MADEDEIILADLDDDELVQQMHDDLYDGLQDEIVEGVKILLDRRWTPYDVLTKALVEGMTIVGIDFRDGILFVPEVLLAANAMKGDRDKCFAAGMDDYVSKPVKKEMLAAAILKWLPEKVARDQEDARGKFVA